MKLKIATAVVALLVLVACNTPWNITTADIIDAAEPTVTALIGISNPALVPVLNEVDAAAKLASQILRNWTPDQAQNAINALQGAITNLNTIAPKLNQQQKAMAVIIAGGLQSVLAVVKQHAPPVTPTWMGQARVEPVTNNLGPLPEFKSAAEYRKAWKAVAR